MELEGGRTRSREKKTFEQSGTELGRSETLLDGCTDELRREKARTQGAWRGVRESF